MNVLYIITSLNKGEGGHFYSLRTIAEELKKYSINPIVVCIGNSPIIEKGTFTKFFYPIKLKVSKINNEIRKLVIDYDIQLLHLFDFIAYRYIMGLRMPHIQTKCGGPYNRFLPNSEYITLFSNENLSDLRKRKKFKYSTLKLIPNRITRFECSFERIQLLKKKIHYDSNERYILRICRISKEYEKSIRQGSELSQNLKAIGFKNRFIVIGNVYDAVVFNKLKTECPELIWVTDPEFTHNAKELIDFCDIYLGTGRGVMEASKYKKLILVPTNNRDLPALLHESNFKQFFDVNFSQRLNVRINNEELLESLVNYLTGAANKENLLNFYEEMFDNFFNIETASDKYISLYNLVIENYDNKKISLSAFDQIAYMFYHKYLLIRYASKK